MPVKATGIVSVGTKPELRYGRNNIKKLNVPAPSGVLATNPKKTESQVITNIYKICTANCSYKRLCTCLKPFASNLENKKHRLPADNGISGFQLVHGAGLHLGFDSVPDGVGLGGQRVYLGLQLLKLGNLAFAPRFLVRGRGL